MTKIYISSTYSDLVEHRQQVYDILRKMRYDVIAMEDYVATDERPLDRCLADVASCHIYVGIFAWRYGYVPPGQERSITELEYRQAGLVRLERLIFLLDEDAPWPRQYMDEVTGKGERGQRIKALRQELMAAHHVQFFKSPEELTGQVAASVAEWARAKWPDAPFQAPPDVPQFVGREKELVEFRKDLTHAPGQNIYCLTGMGGIGKTALAIHLAHALRGDFPDGVLWANAATSEPLAILDSWARAYDRDFTGLPDLDTRAAALRGVLADKKILVILDDVQSADQVPPLLPGGPQCTVLLTTRDSALASALATDPKKKTNEPLSALTPLESRQLLSHFVGNERVIAEVTFAGEICHLLGNLPLAVEIAARRLASRRRWRLADLAERLRDEKNRLDELRISDREVRASFTVSWEALDEDLRKSLALLAVFEGRAFTAPAFAAVAKMDEWRAEDSLYALVALSLVSDEGEAHYRQHPLLADFAREHLRQNEAAYARMVQYYLEYAKKHQHNYAELEKEWDNLSASLWMAYQRKMWPVVIDYSEVLAEAWFARGRFSDARQGSRWACEAAWALEDRQVFASCLRQWGRACIEQSDYAKAEELLSHSLQLWQELDDQRGVASAQSYLGRLAFDKGNYAEAQRLLVEAQCIWEQLDDQQYTAYVLYLRAMVELDHKRYEEAEWLGEKALRLQQAVGDKTGSMRTLTLLAEIAHRQRCYDLAVERCQQALDLGEELQDRKELALTLYTLCKVLQRRGEAESALEKGERSLNLLRAIGHRRGQAQVLLQLSLIHVELSDLTTALQEGQQSLDLCRELQDRWGTVWVLRDLGDVYRLLNQPDQARQVWSEALQIATEEKHPETDSLRERLAQLPPAAESA